MKPVPHKIPILVRKNIVFGIVFHPLENYGLLMSIILLFLLNSFTRNNGKLNLR